jgi:hypothetical protein|tara:strand:+ start:8412 stop:8585 length:174 start_codon:yes stop_codon:yes gene_type:complete
MTMDELMQKILDICPEALFTEGEEGEIIIETGLYGDYNAVSPSGYVNSVPNVHRKNR